MATGEKTNNISNLVGLIDELIGNRNGTTARIKVSDLLKMLPGEINGPRYETLAELEADLAWDTGFVGLVWGDNDVEARGLYWKTGDAGTGSWEWYAEPPFAALVLAEVSVIQAAIVLAAAAAAEDAEATAADRIATGEDATATAADRVATGQDATATAADRVATGQDAAATAADRVATGQDAVATAADRAATLAARDAALSAFANFQDQYLGMFAADPTTDIDGSALDGGELYFNSVSQVMRVYNGTAWGAAYVSAEGVLMAANSLSDVPDKAAARVALELKSLAQQDAAALSAGIIVTTPHPIGDISSGTLAPDVTNGNIQTVGNEGAFQIDPPSVAGWYTMIVQLVNGAAPGVITFGSAFASVTGDAISTTTGEAFSLRFTKEGAYSTVAVVAQQ